MFFKSKMTKYHHLLIVMAAASLFFSCKKYISAADARGGDLPGYYISVKNDSFSPSSLTAVSGSSIRFVNNTSTSKSIITTDSATIRLTLIQPDSSFLFNKDTSGTFVCKLAGKPSVQTIITLTP